MGCEGAGRIGEFAFGTNPGITRFTRNGLVDEKIGGTVRLALDASPPAIGGRNRSALHLALVCDPCDGGEAWVDGRLFATEGQFVV